MHLTQHLHHVAIGVNDLDASIRWYEQYLGFTFERRFTLPEAGLAIAYLASDAVRIELLQRDGVTVAPADGPQPTHICFEVADVEAAAREMQRRGIDFLQEVKVIPPAGVKNCWIRDNTGTSIEFIERIGADR